MTLKYLQFMTIPIYKIDIVFYRLRKYNDDAYCACMPVAGEIIMEVDNKVRALDDVTDVNVMLPRPEPDI